MALETPQPGGDSYLRSCNAVAGHMMQARDGEIGHADDLLSPAAIRQVELPVVERRLAHHWIYPALE